MRGMGDSAPIPAPGPRPAGAEHIRQERTPTEQAHDAIRELSERDKAFVQKEFGDGRFWKLKAFMEGTSWRETGRAENPRQPTWLGRMYQRFRAQVQGEEEPPARDPRYPAATRRREEIDQLGQEARFLGQSTEPGRAAERRRWFKTGAKILGGGALAACMPLSGGLGAVLSAPLFIAGFREMVDGGVGILQAGWNLLGNRLKQRWQAQDRARLAAGATDIDPTGRPNPNLGAMSPIRRHSEAVKIFWRNFVEKTTLEDERRPRARVSRRIRELKEMARRPGITAPTIQRAIEAMHADEQRLQALRDHNLTVKRLYKFGRNFISTIASVGGAIWQGLPLGFNDQKWWGWVAKASWPDKLVAAPIGLLGKTIAHSGPAAAYLAYRWSEFSHLGLEQHFGDSASDWIKNLKPSHEYTGERVTQEKTVVEQYLEQAQRTEMGNEYFRALAADAAAFGTMDPACRLVVTINNNRELNQALTGYAKQQTPTSAPVNWQEIEFLVRRTADTDPAALTKTIQAIKKNNPTIKIHVVNRRLAAPGGVWFEQKYLDDLALMRDIQRTNRVQKPLYIVNGVNDGAQDKNFLDSILRRVDVKNPPAILTGASHELRAVQPRFRQFFAGLNDLENYLEGDWPNGSLRDANYAVFRAEDYAQAGGVRRAPGPTGGAEYIAATIVNDLARRRERRPATTNEQQEYLTRELTDLYRWYALYPSFREYRGDKAKFAAEVLAKPRLGAPNTAIDDQILHGEGRRAFVRWMETGFGLIEGQHYFVRDNTRDIHLNLDPAGTNWNTIRTALSARGRVP